MLQTVAESQDVTNVTEIDGIVAESDLNLRHP